jgi:hypothetical protein
VAVEQMLDHLRLLVGVDEADENGAGLHGVDHIDRRRLHAQHHIRIRDQRRDIGHEDDILERVIMQPDGVARTALHMQPGAELPQLGYIARHQGDPPLMRPGLLQNGDIHIHRDQTGASRTA